MELKQQFGPFIDDLRATHGKNLVSVILYGSAAAGDFVPKRSDYNILIALDRITPKDLREAHACIREWNKLGHPVPVYFTASELRTAADVFPIEFHQMQEAHKVLYGKDVVADLEIHDDFLRHQIEYELRSKLLLLRRQYIPASTTAQGLERLMTESLVSFSALFRAVLLLLEVRPPANKRAVVAMAAERLGLDGRPFAKIFTIRDEALADELNEEGSNALFAEYLEQIEKAIDAVDAIATGGKAA